MWVSKQVYTAAKMWFTSIGSLHQANQIEAGSTCTFIVGELAQGLGSELHVVSAF